MTDTRHDNPRLPDPRDFAEMAAERWQIAAALRIARLFTGWPKVTRPQRETNRLRRERRA